MTRQEREQLGAIKERIRANAVFITLHGDDIREADGTLPSNNITDLFTQLRELEAVIGTAADG